MRTPPSGDAIPTSDHNSFHRVLEFYFGRRWHVWLLLVTAALLWPLLLFRQEIRFDPALFTTEYLKILATSLLFYYVGRVLTTRYMRKEARITDVEILRDAMLPSFTALAEGLGLCIAHRRDRTIPADRLLANLMDATEQLLTLKHSALTTRIQDRDLAQLVPRILSSSGMGTLRSVVSALGDGQRWHTVSEDDLLRTQRFAEECISSLSKMLHQLINTPYQP